MHDDDYRPRHDEERQWRLEDDREPVLVTQSLPMSPAMQACVKGRSSSRVLRPLLAFPLLVGAVLLFGFSRVDFGTVALAVAIVLVAGGAYLAWDRRVIRHDLAAGTFSRYGGPWKATVGRHGPYVELPDGSQFDLPQYAIFQAYEIGAGEVDFTPNTRIAFEIRDAKGNVLYRHPDYHP